MTVGDRQLLMLCHPRLAVKQNDRLAPVEPLRSCTKTMILRAEMARQNVSYLQLVERLESIGVTEDERNLRNKVSRGKVTAAFMLQCLSALGSRELRLD